MKTLLNFAALSLSIVLGLMPFAVIAIDDASAASSSGAHALVAQSTLGTEGR